MLDEHASANQMSPINIPTPAAAKTPVPTKLLAQRTGYDLARERARVDSHVENRKSRIATCATFGIQIADDRGDVWFEQTGAAAR